jgi:hypothetical protein
VRKAGKQTLEFFNWEKTDKATELRRALK